MRFKNKIETILTKLNQLLLPLEFNCDLNKDRYALLSGDSLFSGNLGLVIYHYYYSKVTGNNQSKERATELLQNIIERVDEEKTSLGNYTLSYGIAGLGYVLNHLVNEDFIEYSGQEIEKINELIYEWALEMIENDDSEFMHGAFGAILYLSKNRVTPKIEFYLSNLIEKLTKQANHTNDGIYFDFFNKLVPEYPKGTINLSLSHGLCGILLILIDLLKKKLIKSETKTLVIDGIKFLESNLSPVDFSQKIYCFSDSVIFEDRLEKRNTRLAWCYGDLNPALVFLKAGELFKNERYTEIGNEIALTTLNRKDYEQTFIKDSQFCHGTSGLVQVYHRIYQMTGNDSYLKGRDFWIEKTLDYLENEIDSNYYNKDNKTGELLEGLAGVGLVLLSTLSIDNQEDLLWDELFLLSSTD